MAKRILMIDDSVEMCEEISDILRDEGFDVDVAHDGHAGDALLQEHSYDLVLLDLMIPGINGFDLLRRLRSRKTETKVLVITGRPIGSDLLRPPEDRDDHEGEALAYADGVINKPCGMEELIQAVHDAVREEA